MATSEDAGESGEETDGECDENGGLGEDPADECSQQDDGYRGPADHGELFCRRESSVLFVQSALGQTVTHCPEASEFL